VQQQQQQQQRQAADAFLDLFPTHAALPAGPKAGAAFLAAAPDVRMQLGAAPALGGATVLEGDRQQLQPQLLLADSDEFGDFVQA
jgi:hypothetical protein